MALVKKVMKTSLVTATSEETVAAVCKRMKESHLGAILVVNDNQLSGIFTERDLLNRVISEGLDPETTNVMAVATPNPIVVKDDTHIKECAEILRDQGFRHLPVMDQEGNPAGIVSSRDFFQYMADELEQVIDRMRGTDEKVDESFDIYEYLGAGGCGLPRL